MTDLADRPDLTAYELDDRFRREDGRVFLSGVQALARLPVDQLRIDRRNGLRHRRVRVRLPGLARRHVPGGGSAAAAARCPICPSSSVPASTRSWRRRRSWAASSPTRSATSATTASSASGTARRPASTGPATPSATACSPAPSRHGGVVAIVGDDPAAKSSTLPSSSDATLVDLHMPILFPGDVQEALDLGRHAVALSRASGMWVGFKLVTPVADGTGTVDVHPDRVDAGHPDDGVRRQAVRAPPERSAAHAVHARDGARVPAGALGAGPPLRRRSTSSTGSTVAHRATTGSASPPAATRTTSCARR